MTEPLKLLPPALKIDRGKARALNEDWADYEIPQDPDLLAQKGMLFVLADGMGGNGRGQEASRTAVKTVISVYYGEASTDVRPSLVSAFKVANGEVFKMKSRVRDEGRMASTLVAAVIRDNELYVAHVGDSRAYRVRGNTIRQLTQDHSWVAEQQRAGLLTDDQAQAHPQRGVITRAIGAHRKLEVDTSRHRLKPGDAVILCSDGLTGQMTDAEIKEHVTSLSPHEAAGRMVDTVNRRGGPDNISVLIVKSEGPAPAPSRPPVAWLAGVAAALVVVVLLGLITWRLVGSSPPSTPADATLPAVVAPGPSPTLSPSAAATETEAPAGILAPTATLRPTSTWTHTPTRRPATQTPAPQPTSPPGETEAPGQEEPEKTSPPPSGATDTPQPPSPPTNTPGAAPPPTDTPAVPSLPTAPSPIAPPSPTSEV